MKGNTPSAVQELDTEWRRTVLDLQEKMHAVAVKLLRAIFIGLGRNDRVIVEVHISLLKIWTAACRSPRTGI